MRIYAEVSTRWKNNELLNNHLRMPRLPPCPCGTELFLRPYGFGASGGCGFPQRALIPLPPAKTPLRLLGTCILLQRSHFTPSIVPLRPRQNLPSSQHRRVIVRHMQGPARQVDELRNHNSQPVVDLLCLLVRTCKRSTRSYSRLGSSCRRSCGRVIRHNSLLCSRAVSL